VLPLSPTAYAADPVQRVWAGAAITSSFLFHSLVMDRVPNDILLEYFQSLLPPLAVQYRQRDDLSYHYEEFELFRGLSACRDVCRRWKWVMKENPGILSRYCYVNATNMELVLQRLKERLGKPSKKPTRGSLINRLFFQPPPIDPPGPFPPIEEGLKECKELTHLHWGRPEAWVGRFDYPSQYPNLENLTRLDWYFFDDGSANAFKKLVHHAPGIQHIVVTGYSNVDRFDCPFTLPASLNAVTLSSTYGDHAIDQWVSTWNIPNGVSLEYLASTSPDMAFHHLLPNATAIEVLPLSIINKLEPFLINLPITITTHSLTYNAVLTSPLRDTLGRFPGVRNISLKTYATRPEQMKASFARLHLSDPSDNDLKRFHNLQRVRLCADFRLWCEKKDLQHFTQRVGRKAVVVEYIWG